MNDQQIKARCEKFADETWTYGIVPDLESLYREAMAAGLERAGHEVVFHAYAKDFAIWCQHEAQRVKEGK